MKTERQTRSRDTQGTERGFNWSVRCTDIPFMGPEHQAIGADGCDCVGTDCGCAISKLNAARDRAPRDEQP